MWLSAAAFGPARQIIDALCGLQPSSVGDQRGVKHVIRAQPPFPLAQIGASSCPMSTGGAILRRRHCFIPRSASRMLLLFLVLGVFFPPVERAEAVARIGGRHGEGGGRGRRHRRGTQRRASLPVSQTPQPAPPLTLTFDWVAPRFCMYFHFCLLVDGCGGTAKMKSVGFQFIVDYSMGVGRPDTTVAKTELSSIEAGVYQQVRAPWQRCCRQWLKSWRSSMRSALHDLGVAEGT